MGTGRRVYSDKVEELSKPLQQMTNILRGLLIVLVLTLLAEAKSVL
jgi:hypothetical protein